MTRTGSVRDLVLDSLLAQVPLVVFAYDCEGICTYSDGAGLSAWGLRPGELVGANIFDLYGGQPEGMAWLRDALQGRPGLYTWRNGDVTGELWLTPLTDDTGRVTGAIGITLDVSEKARAQEDLDLHRAFVEAAPQFVALAGIDGRVKYVNPGGRRMAGLPEDLDVTTTTISDYLTEEGLRRSLEVEQPAVLERGVYDGETTLKHWPSGRGIPVRVSSFLVRDGVTGEPRALATVQTDISAQKVARREAERRISQQRGLLLHLHEAQELERRRIAGEVHDDTIQAVAAVNIRLQSLRRMLADAGLDQEATAVRQMSDTVRQAAERLRRLLYHLDSPDELERDLAAGLRDYATMTGSADGPEVEVVSRLAGKPPAHVSRVLFRIAQEALNNARAHSEARTVTVVAAERDDGYTISVRDDGVGLPKHLATSARGRRPAVAGHLGLRSMAERAESAGGWCSVRNLDDGGTLVEAWVPARIGYSSVTAGGTDALGLAQTLLEQTMESISEGFMALDRDWRYVYVNQIGADIVRRHDLPGKVCWDEFEFSPEVEQAYRTAVREQRPTTARVFYADLGRWVESRVFPSAEGISVFFRDVTEEQELEQRASERERIITGGLDLVQVLASEPELRQALLAGLAGLRARWELAGLALDLRVPGGEHVVLSVGETADGQVTELPVALRGETIGTLRVAGVGPIQELQAICDILSLRIAAG